MAPVANANTPPVHAASAAIPIRRSKFEDDDELKSNPAAATHSAIKAARQVVGRSCVSVQAHRRKRDRQRAAQQGGTQDGRYRQEEN
jgi:hypothetical protein